MTSRTFSKSHNPFQPPWFGLVAIRPTGNIHADGQACPKSDCMTDMMLTTRAGGDDGRITTRRLSADNMSLSEKGVVRNSVWSQGFLSLRVAQDVNQRRGRTWGFLRVCMVNNGRRRCCRHWKHYNESFTKCPATQLGTGDGDGHISLWPQIELTKDLFYRYPRRPHNGPQTVNKEINKTILVQPRGWVLVGGFVSRIVFPFHDLLFRRLGIVQVAYTRD